MDYSSFSDYPTPVAGYERPKKKKGISSVKLSTDPQSVAARERRHRISERFKILQSMVPGGSKMDTVSMLEQAIHYVKFLKAQIWLHQAMIDLVDDAAAPPPLHPSFNSQELGFSDDCLAVDGVVPESWFSGEENWGYDSIFNDSR